MSRQEVEYAPDFGFLNHVENVQKYKNKRQNDRLRWTGIEPELMSVVFLYHTKYHYFYLPAAFWTGIRCANHCATTPNGFA